MLFLQICIGILIFIFLYLVISDIKNIYLTNKEIKYINKAMEMQMHSSEQLNESLSSYEYSDCDDIIPTASSLYDQTCLKILETNESIETLLNYTIEQCREASKNLRFFTFVDYSTYKKELGESFKQSLDDLIIILKNLRFKVTSVPEADYKLRVDFSEDR